MAYKIAHPLPLPATDEAIVTVTPFETCQLQIPASLAIAGLTGKKSSTSWRFLIQHKPSDTILWFDLGVSHDLSQYPPRTQEVQHKVFNVIAGQRSPAEDVESLGLDPGKVKYIVASHAHWDHIFPAGAFHPNATVLCGAGTIHYATPSWPTSATSTFDGRIWDSAISELPIEEFPPAPASVTNTSNKLTNGTVSAQNSRYTFNWQRLGPYANAHDFFGDGSFWIIDAPGHCEGNIAGLVRMRNKEGRLKWAFLGGDCFHIHHFVTFPEAPFGRGVKVTKSGTLHEDEEGAREIIRQTAELKQGEGQDALIWIAHTENLEGIWEF